MLIDRTNSFSNIADGARRTNQPHREFVYRPAFEVGRHVIGYELQKILAAMDWFKSLPVSVPRKTAVVGYGEGGLLALYAGAIDPRIDAVGVSGAFGPCENLWQQPICRNVQGLLREFGGAELASLIAPRALVIDSVNWPKVEGPPAPAPGQIDGAAPGQVVVMDNLPAHKSPQVERLLEGADCRALRLPPYSPDYNPIEMAISKVKRLLRSKAERTVPGLLDAIDDALRAVTAADANGFVRHCGYAATIA